MDKYYGHLLVLGQVEKFTICMDLVDIHLYISALLNQIELKLCEVSWQPVFYNYIHSLSASTLGKVIRLGCILANLSTTSLASTLISLCRLNKHNPVSLSWPMVERSLVFTNPRVLILRSHSQDVTGKVDAIFNTVFTFGYNPSSHDFSASSRVCGGDGWPVHFLLHISTSCSKVAGDGRSSTKKDNVSALVVSFTGGRSCRAIVAFLFNSLKRSAICWFKWSRNGMTSVRL